MVALVVLAVGPAALRFYQVEPTDSAAGSVNVAIVQGNIPGRGIEALGRARSVTNNHLSETVDLMTRVRLGQERPPDFVLWPENSTDIDPTKDALTRLTVDAAARVAGTPIMVGAVMQGPGEDERQTTALWWEPGRGRSPATTSAIWCPSANGSRSALSSSRSSRSWRRSVRSRCRAQRPGYCRSS